MKRTSPKFLQAVIPLIFLILATVLVFGRVAGAQFLAFDDGEHVFDNPYLNPPALANVPVFWMVPFRPRYAPPGSTLPPYEQLYAPLTFTIYEAIAPIARFSQPQLTPTGTTSRLNPATFHLLNLLVHILNVCALFALLFRVTRSRPAALAGAFVFAVHPIQAEAVGWVTQLNTLLSTLFALVAITAYLVSREPPRAGKKSGRLWYALGTLSFLCSLLCKPTSVLVPLLVPLLAWNWRTEPGAETPPSRPLVSFNRFLRESWPTLLPWLALSGLFYWINRGLQPPDDAALYVPWSHRVFQIGDAEAFYLYKVFLPVHQMPDYSRTSHYVLTHLWGYLTWLFPAGLLAGAYRVRNRRPEIPRGLLFFLITILPTSGVVAYYWHWYSTVADRYAYLSMAGAGLAAAGLWLEIESASPARARLGKIGFATVLTVWGALAFLDAGHWHDVRSLWAYNAEHNPTSYLARDSLGNYYKTEEPPELDKAVAMYRAALACAPGQNPEVSLTEYNLGILLSDMGQVPEAIVQLERALVQDPGDPEVLNSLAVALAEENRTAEAVRTWRQAIAIDPDDKDAHTNYAVELANLGRTAEAIEQWEQVLRLDPGNVAVRYDLGVALMKEGQKDRAAQMWRQALSLDPGNVQLSELLAKLK